MYRALPIYQYQWRIKGGGGDARPPFQKQIKNKGTMDDHIKKTKGKTEAALQTIFNIAGNKDFNQLEIKTIWKLVETCIIPTILYAAETWTITKKETEQLQKILDNVIRRILLTPPTTPREILQLETGIWDIESMIHEKQLMYYHKITKAKNGLIKNTAMDISTPWNKHIQTTIQKYNLDHDTINNLSKTR